MTESDIYQKMTAVFQEVFGRDDIVPHAQMTAKEVAEWDSLAHIRLIFAVEEAFNIRFSSTETQLLENVGGFVKTIQAKLTKAA